MAQEIAQFTFESEEWKKFLTKLQRKWGSLIVGTSTLRREFSGLISVHVFKDVMEHFKEERGPTGAWQDWSKTYADHLNKIGRGGNKKLQFSGKLRQTFLPSNHRNINEGVLFYNNALTKKGFPYAKAHDEGGKKEGRPPQRKFMWLSDAGMNNIVKDSLAWLAEK